MSTNSQSDIEEENVSSTLRAPEIYLSGMSHHTSPIDTRERFSMTEDRIQLLLEELSSLDGILEVVVASTCNRVEVIWSALQGDFKTSVIEEKISKVAGVCHSEFSRVGYHLSGEVAVKHLYRVASGLDSMIVGENQILGQLKTAYSTAHEQGFTSHLLNRVFSRSFNVAKEVRTQTRIGERSLSVCSVARDLAEQIMGDLSSSTVLLLGAGDTGRLALKHFKAAGVRDLLVGNRSEVKGRKVAKEFGSTYFTLAQTEQYLSSADVIIGSSTRQTNQDFFLKASQMASSLEKRKGKPQLCIDLGVPRNFDPKISDIENSFLYNIDHLQEVVSHNLGARREEMQIAEKIVDSAVSKFQIWRQGQFLEPLISDALESFDSLRKVEIARTLKRFRSENYSAAQLREIEQGFEVLSKTLVTKAFYRPIESLKNDAESKHSVFETFKNFFTG